MLKLKNKTFIHLWVPNLFEFKGGIQIYLQDVLRTLNDEFPRLSLLVFDKLDSHQPKNSFDSPQISFLFSGNTPRYLQTLHFTIKLILGALKNRPNLILCGHINFAPVAFLIYRITTVPYWIIVYGTEVWDVQESSKIKALQAANQIISISSYTRERLINEQKISLEKISLLPVTFDADRFKISSKPYYLLKRYGLQVQQPIILTVGRLSSFDRYKGYDQILKSLPKIRHEIPNIHYILVGKGDDRPRIEQLISQLNLQECVTLAGFVADDELCDHYNLCDVFAMPSKGEGFGIVYLEALACGKPTVGGNQDGAIDALCQGELGALVNPDDVEAIAKTLIQILQGTYPNSLLYEPELLREKVIERFSVQQFNQTLSNLIKKSQILES
ncbi:MAG TPA: glycosyltransferase family 4 protein [Candidatus Sericytochromatia bacterium]|jgi:phosphatidylinositol alpha-1,6-mannosyltransferase